MISRKLLLSLLIVFLLAHHQELMPQAYYFDNYSVKQGLPDSRINDMAFDSLNTLWLGTRSGLSAFNGHNFRNYTTLDGLAPNSVRSVFIDKDGIIWTGHYSGGLSRFDGDKFQSVHFEGVKLSKDIYDIHSDNDGNIWLATTGEGAIKFRKSAKDTLGRNDYQIYRGQEGLSDVVLSIEKFGAKMYFITDFGVLRVYNADNDNFDVVKFADIPANIRFLSLKTTPDAMYLGTSDGRLIKSTDGDGAQFINTRRMGNGAWVSCILPTDDPEKIWTGIWNRGLLLHDGEERILFDKSNGLISSQIRCALHDHDGNILLGTSESGLLIFRGRQFLNYNNIPVLQGRQVWAILKTEDFFWLGTNNGIIRMKSLKKSEDLNNFTIYAPQFNNSHASKIRFLRQDKQGNIWAASVDQRLLLYDASKDSFVPVRAIDPYFRKDLDRISGLIVDTKDKLWIGTLAGLLHFDPETGNVQRFTQRDSLPGNNISGLYYNDNKDIWLGSVGKGIAAKTPASGFRRIAGTAPLTPLCFTSVHDELWAGTEGQGIVIIGKNDSIRKMSVENGLLSAYISMLYTTQKDNVLIGTNRGLNIFNPASGQLLSLTEQQGFTGIEVKSNAVFEAAGKVYIGTVNGLIQLDEDHLDFETYRPEVFLNQMLVNLQEADPRTSNVFPHSKNSFYFSFISPDYTDPQAIKYKVRLRGSDVEWRPPTSQGFISFSSLPPGDYTLEVKAMNAQAQWSKEPMTYSFRVRPPFYMRWWFLLSIGALIVIAIYLFILIREKQLKLEKKILEEKVAERTHEVTEKNIELARINKDITDSINYARRIQAAIMRPAEEIQKILPQSFILYKPRDIVSGDFYWFSEKHNLSVIVAADCTGHGVPGAFMSMIGISYLNEIVNEKKILEADQILNLLRANLISVLQQKGREGDAKEGMDMALMTIDRQNKVLSFAGAYNSLYLLRKTDRNNKNQTPEADHEALIEIKGDRMPVGVSTKDHRPFNAKQIEWETGDRFFMTTDGFIDQFGGPKGKKFLNKRFRELLVQFKDQPVAALPGILDKAFNDWKTDLEQIDDVLVIGGDLE